MPKDSMPEVRRCIITGPDGVKRHAWEIRVMREGGELVLKDANKESLEKTYTRLFMEPMPSMHWRHARSRDFMGRRH